MISGIEDSYISLLRQLVGNYEKGLTQSNRTGTDTIKLPPQMIQHDMSKGFPILTTKQIAWKTLKVELEGFIKGVTSKGWFQERGCKIWDEWCNPQKIPYSTEPEVQEKMKQEDDLGPCIYGASWRNFHDPMTISANNHKDQFKSVVDTLKSNPYDRRMICLAWNPLGLGHTALPACHVLWQVTVRGDFLDLTWYQRSVDTFLGLPFNLSSYALLLHLLAKESGLKEGCVTGMLSDVHLYVNHVDAAKEQIARLNDAYKLPTLETSNWSSIYEWEHEDTILKDYQSHGRIKAKVAV